MEALDTLAQQLKSQATLIDTSTAPRISLHQPDQLWLLEQGSVDIFALEETGEKGQLELAHFLVTEILAPALIFNFAGQELLRLGARASSRLYQIPVSLFQTWAEKKENLPILNAAVSKWIFHLSEVFKDENVIFTPFLTRSEVLLLKEKELFSLKIAENPEERNQVQWIEVLEGELSHSVFAEFRLNEHQIFPLSPHLVLKAEKVSRVRVISENEIFSSKKWKEGFDLFHLCFSNFLKAFFKRREEEQKNQIVVKKQAEQEMLGEALYHMSIVLEPEIKVTMTDQGDALFKACQLVGSQLGIEFLSMKQNSSDLVTAIDNICRFSSIRYRKVALRADWWKKDCGPLLCFYGPDQVPVALIFEKSSYILMDPSKKIQKKLTPDLGRELAPFAYTFYPPLPSTTKGFKLILRAALSSHVEMWAIFSSGIWGALFTLFPPFATFLLFNAVLPSRDISLLTQLIIGLILASFAVTAFFAVRAISILRFEGKISNFLQAGFMDRLLELPVQFFRKYSLGDLINRLLAIEQMRRLLSGNATQAIISALFALLYLLVMFYFSSFLFIPAFLFFLVGLGVTFLCLHLRSKGMQKIYELDAAINSAVLQMISGVRKLRVSASETKAFSHWAELFASWVKIRLKLQTIQNVSTVVSSVLPSLTTTTIFAFFIFFMDSPKEFTSTKMELPAFLGFYIALALFFTSLFNVGSILFTLSPIPALWNRARVILETKPEEVKKGTKVEELNGSFAVDKVSFRYSPDQPYVIHEISIQGNPGEFIAIVGPSGCGKSTLINFLLGFYAPDTGGIYYNGKDLQTCDIRGVRRQIGTVLQHDSLLSGTIYDNIVAGRAFAKQDIEKALELSGFSEDLKDFPMGLYTFLSVGGETLSRGQKQKLLIARAMIGNPKIIIFDEATSALDNVSQEWIAGQIAGLNITRITIAHRLSTVRSADRIYVLDKGKIVDTGTFHELENRPGLFSDMLAKQKL